MKRLWLNACPVFLLVVLNACTVGKTAVQTTATAAYTNGVTPQPSPQNVIETPAPTFPTAPIDGMISPNGQWSAVFHPEISALEVVSAQGNPPILYQPGGTAEWMELGSWSPDSRFLTFWQGPQGASIQADGLPLWVLDTQTGEARMLAETALVNPRYQSWSPDGTALVFTNGGHRSLAFGKWMTLVQVEENQFVEQALPKTLVPGMLSWSPDGSQIAVAAVEAAQTNPPYANQMGWDNPAVAARRIYLVDPTSGKNRLIQPSGEYQDAPRWSEDGLRLTYVQKEGSLARLVSINIVTGEIGVIPGCEISIPEVTYYGQVDWSELYNSCLNIP